MNTLSVKRTIVKNEQDYLDWLKTLDLLPVPFTLLLLFFFA